MRPCQQCGHALVNNERTCPKCGARQTEPVGIAEKPPPAVDPPEPPSPSERTASAVAFVWLVRVILLIPVLGCALLGWMLWGTQGAVGGFLAGLLVVGLLTQLEIF